MTRDEAIKLTKSYIESQFPKTCGRCGRKFDSLADYLRFTTHIGAPMNYDERSGPKPKEPLGIFSFANCLCGNTLVIDSGRMRLTTFWRLLMWARGETKRRGISWKALLSEVRAEIDRRALEGRD
jgi:hypothetical protein